MTNDHNHAIISAKPYAKNTYHYWIDKDVKWQLLEKDDTGAVDFL